MISKKNFFIFLGDSSVFPLLLMIFSFLEEKRTAFITKSALIFPKHADNSAFLCTFAA